MKSILAWTQHAIPLPQTFVELIAFLAVLVVVGLLVAFTISRL